MAVTTLVTTAGDASANAYCTRAFATQFHEDRPQGAAWAALSPDDQDRAILWATKLLDALWDWNGVPVSLTQALLWPRNGLMKRNGLEGVDPNTIPVELQQACAEFAKQLAAADRTADSQIETLGVTSFRAGPVAFSFKEGVEAKTVPDAVVDLIPPGWGYVRGQVKGMRDLVRV